MAFFSDEFRVVDLLNKQRDMILIAEPPSSIISVVYSTSPPGPELMFRSPSLEADNPMNPSASNPSGRGNPGVVQDGRVNKSNPASNSDQKAVVTFSSQKSSEFTIEKDDKFAERIIPKPVGALGDMIKKQVVKMLNMIVFPGGHSRPLRFQVEDTATVEQTIAAALKQHQLESRHPPITPTNPKAWILRCADEADDLIPVELNAQSYIKEFGTTFALVKNVLWKDTGEEGAPRRTLSDRRSVTSVFIKGSPADTTSTEPQSSTLKIHLPNGEYNYLPWVGESKIGQLCVRICLRRNLDAATHELRMENNVAINPNATLSELQLIEVWLCQIDPKNPNTSTSTEDHFDYSNWSDAAAAQYQEFKVTKLKKRPFGQTKYEERVIGVARHIITNNSATHEKTKRPHRLMKEVNKVGLVEGRPTQWLIIYGTGPNAKEYRYEAVNAREAAAVVGKIRHILQMDLKTS